MPEGINSRLHDKLDDKGFTPQHVAEVGVWHPHTSNVHQYIVSGVRTTLVEPDPESIALIKQAFGDKDNVTLHQVAISDTPGEIELVKRDSSTFVSTLPASPALINDSCDIEDSEKFTVNSVLFSDIDDGTIDLVSVDTEGSEWFVIKTMKSRPTVISLETHGGMYTNPYLTELTEWLRINNYTLWYKDKSDSVFVLSDAIAVTFSDRAAVFTENILLAVKSRKKRLTKFLKGILK